jgi:hypothetical protein
LSTLLQLAAAVNTLLLGQGFAVIGASGPGSPPPGTVASVAEGLRASGSVAVSGGELQKRLLGDAEPVGEFSEALAAIYARALAAYDEGAYRDSVKDAQAAFEALSGAPPSTRREALARQTQLVWGAALVQLRESSSARSHFRWALDRDPLLIADHDRFPPPVQSAFERERSGIAAEPPARLAVGVSGIESAPPQLMGQVIVDGLPRGALPRDLSLPTHPTVFWVEAGNAKSWAHHALLSSDHPLSVDVDLALEAALVREDGQVLLALPTTPKQRQALIGALTLRARTTDLVVVAEAVPPGSPARFTATRFGAGGAVIAKATFDGEQGASASVAQALRGTALSSSAEVPEPPPTSDVHKHADEFPVLPVVLGVIGVVAVATVLTAVLWPKSFEMTLTPSSPR